MWIASSIPERRLQGAAAGVLELGPARFIVGLDLRRSSVSAIRQAM